MKIAFVINFSKKSWLGGFNYYKNFFYFLDKYKKELTPVIITDNKKLIKQYNFFKKYEIHQTNLVDRRKKFLRIFQKLCIFFLGKNFLLINFLKKKNIHSLSHDYPLGCFSTIPSFTWFPDFQEIHLPHNFSFFERFFRKLNVIISGIHSTKIIISSKSAQNDLKTISFRAYKKSKVIRHNDIISLKTKHTPLKQLKKKYNLRNYFVICDQFRKHKNHIVVLKALNYLKSKKRNFTVICTGLFHDWRHRSHTLFLEKYINENNLEDNFKILGIVDEKDLKGLIKNSICLLKPSKFEGLSNSVEQARNLGTKVIMSNIPVHKEQKFVNSYTFNVDDYKKLGQLMIEVSKNKKIGKNNRIKPNLDDKFIRNYIEMIKISASKLKH